MEAAVGCIDSDWVVGEGTGCMACSGHWVLSQVERNMRRISVVVVVAVGAVSEGRMLALVAARFQSSSFLRQYLHLQVQMGEEPRRNSGMVVNMAQMPCPCLRMAERGHRTGMSCSCVPLAFCRSSGLPWTI